MDEQEAEARQWRRERGYCENCGACGDTSCECGGVCECQSEEDDD